MTLTRVAVLGATGETGSSIVNGLLEAGKFSVVALARPASIEKPANRELKKRGIEVVPADLAGSEDDDKVATMTKVTTEYSISWGVRADNTPEYAKYLGYLDSKDLYPDLKFRSSESFLKEVLDGKAEPVYQGNEAIQKMREQLGK